MASNLPKHKVVVTNGPPPGYHQFLASAPPPVWLTACDRCGALVADTDAHDRWHLQQAMRL